MIVWKKIKTTWLLFNMTRMTAARTYKNNQYFDLIKSFVKTTMIKIRNHVWYEEGRNIAQNHPKAKIDNSLKPSRHLC